ncbi:Cyclic nucleotide-binding domain protein [Candidatus Magnetobacterium bavaricum]|uniref:Cyclic nucleotide-binding domain protein n=1 Tax=Candidatus Magnetobacterium bavaricum TaxID=29290 RepID=A0A0F3GZ64_9BACT|nr:Cyclic nucleotide-binding domain protein [Candidatus Magnetobacterium bavaricum]
MAIVDELVKQSLFEGLDVEEVGKLVSYIEDRSYAKGGVVFKEGDPTSGIYMVNTGRIEIKRKLQLDTKTKMLIMLRNIQGDEVRHTSQGWENRFATVEQGQFFGELSVIENRKKHSAEAVAVQDSYLFLLKSEIFSELEVLSPTTMVKVMRAIAKSMSANVRSLDKRILKALMGS